MSAVNTCAYYRGEPEKGLSRIMPYARERGITIAETLHDIPPRVASFRRLQDYIKLGLCQRLIVCSAEDLGDDKWMQLENLLFMRRNGVKLDIIDKPERDCRYRIANAIKLYYSPCHTWSVIHGDEMPVPVRAGGRLPYGYFSAEGTVFSNPPQAEKVRALFKAYAEGLDYRSMERLLEGEGPVPIGAVNNILCSRRYLGGVSEGGTRLPGILSYAEWFAAQQRRMAHEKGSASLPPPEAPFCPARHSEPVVYYRGTTPPPRRGAILVDSGKLEARLQKLIEQLACRALVDFHESYIKERLAEASEALPGAIAAQSACANALRTAVNRLCAGERDEELQNSIDELRDACHVSAFRLRRIFTEKRLFSVSKAETEAFFKRASDMSGLCYEEKSFIASAFILKLTITPDGAKALFADPKTGRTIKKLIPIA